MFAVEFGCWIWQVELFWPVQSISSHSPSYLSLLKHNQDPVSGKKLGSVSALMSLPIAPAYTGAEQEIKNS